MSVSMRSPTPAEVEALSKRLESARVIEFSDADTLLGWCRALEAEARQQLRERSRDLDAMEIVGERAKALAAERDEVERQRVAAIMRNRQLIEGIDERVAERDAALKALAETQHKLDNLAERFKALEVENNERRRQLAAVRTDRDGVWVWRGGEENHPESLVCPVVMTADTLREILAKRGDR